MEAYTNCLAHGELRRTTAESISVACALHSFWTVTAPLHGADTTFVLKVM